VNGDSTSPVYVFLKEAKNVRKIKWNFEVMIPFYMPLAIFVLRPFFSFPQKFLVDREGNVVQHFGELVQPNELVAPIEEVLKKKAN